MRETFLTIFGLFTILSGVGVVVCRNPIYSAASLISCFFGLSAVYILWGATFLGVIQILIYTGAIVVLFVFVVMLLDLGRGPSAHSHGWLTIVGAGATVWFFSLLLLRTLNHAPFFNPKGSAPAPGMRQIAKQLFTEYLWPFEVLSLFMLAMIVAIYALAKPDTTPERRP